MEMFFLNIDEFLSFIDETSFEGNFKSRKHLIEHNFGYFMADFIAKSKYNINDEIIIEKSKPKFKNSDLYFSISHSNNVVAVVFDDYDIGLDIELMKNRDFNSISEYLNLSVKNPDKKTFYKLWTRFEAQYKSKKQNLLSFVLEKDYMCSISSFSRLKKSDCKIYKLNLVKKDKKISLKKYDKKYFVYEEIPFLKVVR